MKYDEIPSIDEIKLEKYLNELLEYFRNQLVDAIKNNKDYRLINDAISGIRSIQRYCEKRNRF